MRRRLYVAFLAAMVLTAGCTTLKRFAYEGFFRDSWQQPERVIEVLRIEPGERVADVGAGAGYFTFHLAEAVGPDGLVYAVDVDPDMIEYLHGRVADGGHDNVEVVLGEYGDPRIPASGVDLIFSCNTYHHIEDRPAYFAHAKQYLRPGGRIAIIDNNGTALFNRLFGHSSSGEVIRSEMAEAGYRLVREHDFVSRQHFLEFAPEAG